MSSISATTLSSAHQSPRAHMDARIAAAAKSGSISATDQTALGKALDSIDSSIASDKSSGAKPQDMKSKIASLIQGQVDSGTLSEDQASELKGFFAQGPGGKGKGGPGGPGGPGGAGGPPPGPPPAEAGSESGASGQDSDRDSSGTSDNDSDDTAAAFGLDAKQLDAMVSFLTQLRDQLASGKTTYDSSANTASNSSGSSTGLVLDTTA